MSRSIPKKQFQRWEEANLKAQHPHTQEYTTYIYICMYGYGTHSSPIESNQPTGNKKKYRVSAVQRRTLMDIRLLLCLVLLLSFSHLQGVFPDDDEEDAKHLKCNWKSQNRTEPTIIKAIIPKPKASATTNECTMLIFALAKETSLAWSSKSDGKRGGKSTRQ